MTGKSPFHRPTRFEILYQQRIEKLMHDYFDLPTTLTLGELTARLVEYGQTKNFLHNFATKLARQMVTGLAANNAQNWRQAASKSLRGKEIYRMLQSELQGNVGARMEQLIAENAHYIKSVPQDVARMLTAHIQTQQMAGLRSEEIMKQIGPKLKHLSRYRIALIARTEVAKADTAITRARAEDIGLNWYQWQTSEDGRVRKSHRKMDQVLINWNDAPSPERLVGEKSVGKYNAGNIYNCRCVALPIVSLDEIKFPAKIYSGGEIKRLTLSEFRRIAKIPLRIAA